MYKICFASICIEKQVEKLHLIFSIKKMLSITDGCNSSNYVFIFSMTWLVETHMLKNTANVNFSLIIAVSKRILWLCFILNNRVGVKIWIYAYDSQMKQQWRLWKKSGSPQPRKKKSKATPKYMLISFLNQKIFVHQEFISPG